MTSEHTTNEEIALLREWRSEWRRSDPDDPECRGKEYWFAPGSDRPRRLPDFEHDWAYTGPLLEELPDDVRVEINKWDVNDKRFQCKLTHGPKLLGIGYGGTRKTASAHAWFAWKKEKECD